MPLSSSESPRRRRSFMLIAAALALVITMSTWDPNLDAANELGFVSALGNGDRRSAIAYAAAAALRTRAPLPQVTSSAATAADWRRPPTP